MSMCGAGGKPCSCQPQEGMLCPEIVALAAQVEGLHRVLQGIASAPYDIEGYPSAKDQAAWMQAQAGKALTLTPPASLALHDAGLLERIAKELDEPFFDNWRRMLRNEAARLRAEAGRDGK